MFNTIPKLVVIFCLGLGPLTSAFTRGDELVRCLDRAAAAASLNQVYLAHREFRLALSYADHTTWALAIATLADALSIRYASTLRAYPKIQNLSDFMELLCLDCRLGGNSNGYIEKDFKNLADA